MDDLIKRLRERPYRRATETEYDAKIRRQNDREEAATALAEAQAEIERLRGELRYIAEATDMYEPCGWAVHRARAALTSPPKDK